MDQHRHRGQAGHWPALRERLGGGRRRHRSGAVSAAGDFKVALRTGIGALGVDLHMGERTSFGVDASVALGPLGVEGSIRHEPNSVGEEKTVSSLDLTMDPPGPFALSVGLDKSYQNQTHAESLGFGASWSSADVEAEFRIDGRSAKDDDPASLSLSFGVTFMAR
jgi:hypothetical protein